MKHSRIAGVPLVFALGILTVALCRQPAAAAGKLTADMLRPALQFASGDANLSPSMLAGACVPRPTIIDEFAPHQWTGANAAIRYGAALRQWAQAGKLAKVRVVTQTPTYYDVAGSSAWVSMPATFTFLVNGKPGIERGVYAFVLVQSGGVWKVQTSAWATTK